LKKASCDYFSKEGAKLNRAPSFRQGKVAASVRVQFATIAEAKDEGSQRRPDIEGAMAMVGACPLHGLEVTG